MDAGRGVDRGVDRGPLDRMADGGVVRDTGEPGTASSEATRLDAFWWVGTAIEIFSRMPRASGAGGGSTLDQNEGLAKQLMSCFGALATDARLLGIAFGVPSGNKSELREAVAAALSRIAGPALNELASRPTAAAPPRAAPGPTPAQAVSAPAALLPSIKKKKPGSYYPPESNCIHGRRFSNDGRWRCVKNRRAEMVELYAGNPALAGNLKEFRKRTDLQLGMWKNYYAGAAIVAARAEGRLDIDDDYYSLPDPEEFGGLPSDRLIGTVVHEQLQKTYLNDGRLASHNVVSEVGRTVAYFIGGAPNARPTPLPLFDLVRETGAPDAISSLAWSLGYPAWHLRPDIVDIDDRKIFEIKPVRSAHKGVLQLWRYVSNFRMSWAFDDITTRPPQPSPMRVYELRLSYPPSSVLKAFELYPLLRARKVGKAYDKYKKVWVQPFALSSLPGLLLYRLRKGNPDEEEPEKVPDIIKGIIIGVLVVAAVAVVAFVLVSLAPVLVPLLLQAISAAALFLAAVVVGAIGIILQPGRQPPVLLPRDVAEILGGALRSDQSRLGQDAAAFIRNASPEVPASSDAPASKPGDYPTPSSDEMPA